MPMVHVEHDYRFDGPDGQRSLPELFDGRSQLILYRFFFEEGVDGWPDAGCAGCSSVADGIPDLGLLHARDITFAMASPAPQANLRRMPSAWVGPTCPGTRSAPNASRLTSGSTSGSASTSSCATRRRLPHLLPPARADGLGHRQHLEHVGPHTLRRAVRRRGRARGLAAGAAVVLVPPSRRVRRSAAVSQRRRQHRRRPGIAGCGRRPFRATSFDPRLRHDAA
jgi:Bacterial protein of unknown function (DUF899)